MEPRPVPTVSLASGVRMPVLGLGTWPMNDDEVADVLPRAAELGYRLVDTAYRYGNEVGVGRGVRATGLPREEMFVTTKLNGEWHAAGRPREALQASLDRLGLDQVDLYLIHWPLPRQDHYVEAWTDLLELQREGLARSVGVSNFKPAHLDRLLAETGRLPEVNQIELSPAVSRPAARAYHAAHNVITQSWSPLGAGGLLDDPVVSGIAAQHGRTSAQVILRWHLMLGLTAVPKSSSPARLARNVDVFDFDLDDAEMAALEALDEGEGAAVDSDVAGH
jgi:2,5-diketo-D-gluconate reductase A